MPINQHFTSRLNIDKKTHRQTKLYDHQILIYRKVPGSIK